MFKNKDVHLFHGRRRDGVLDSTITQVKVIELVKKLQIGKGSEVDEIQPEYRHKRPTQEADTPLDMPQSRGLCPCIGSGSFGCFVDLEKVWIWTRYSSRSIFFPGYALMTVLGPENFRCASKIRQQIARKQGEHSTS